MLQTCTDGGVINKDMVSTDIFSINRRLTIWKSNDPSNLTYPLIWSIFKNITLINQKFPFLVCINQSISCRFSVRIQTIELRVTAESNRITLRRRLCWTIRRFLKEASTIRESSNSFFFVSFENTADETTTHNFKSTVRISHFFYQKFSS